jgi:hypothetical protein
MVAMAIWPAAFVYPANGQSGLVPSTLILVSDVYIEQSHGRVAPGTKVQAKPVPEATGGVAIQGAGPTAPVTCNAQNASSPACYTATQQARPATR